MVRFRCKLTILLLDDSFERKGSGIQYGKLITAQVFTGFHNEKPISRLLPVQSMRPQYVCIVVYTLLNHIKFLQLNLIHSFAYAGMLYSSVNLIPRVLCLFVFQSALIWFPTVVFQHFWKSDKRVWLTGWQPQSVTNPMRHSDTLCLHWSVILPLRFHLFLCSLTLSHCVSLCCFCFLTQSYETIN